MADTLGPNAQRPGPRPSARVKARKEDSCISPLLPFLIALLLPVGVQKNIIHAASIGRPSKAVVSTMAVRRSSSARSRRGRGPLGGISRLDLCVGNRENGEPGSYSYSTINWHAVNEYHGAYSFLHSTWVSMGGLRYAYDADGATPAQQSAIFNYGVRTDPGAWPNTLPACGGP